MIARNPNAREKFDIFVREFGRRVRSVAQMIEVVEDEAVFLSLVEAAEAAVTRGSAKRQKVSSSSSASASAIPAASNPAVEEGSYMAALRGSHSSLWQQQQSKLGRKKDNSNSGIRTGNSPSPMSSSTGGGACFKCGVEGHWARDCDAPRGREWGGGLASVGASSGREEGEVPEKACPCGSGSCLVRISNTAKNPGRKFYTCPLKVVSVWSSRANFICQPSVLTTGENTCLLPVCCLSAEKFSGEELKMTSHFNIINPNILGT